MHKSSLIFCFCLLALCTALSVPAWVTLAEAAIRVKVTYGVVSKTVSGDVSRSTSQELFAMDGNNVIDHDVTRRGKVAIAVKNEAKTSSFSSKTLVENGSLVRIYQGYGDDIKFVVKITGRSCHATVLFQKKRNQRLFFSRLPSGQNAFFTNVNATNVLCSISK